MGAGIEAVFRREEIAVLGALAALILLAWMAVLLGAGTGMDPAAMSGWFLPLTGAPALSGEWSAIYWLISFCMWTAMMVAMMLPSASPMVLLYARLARQAAPREGASGAGASIAAFASGYLSLWILFSLLAVVLQWALEQMGAMSAMMNSRVPLLSGLLLIAAGLYQLTPLKGACLKHCRSPAQFIAGRWRPGAVGAWRMGLTHGAFCLGCCALLMLLLFVGGVMNLVWIAGLTLVVAVEKLAPFGDWISKAVAALLIAAGTVLVLS